MSLGIAIEDFPGERERKFLIMIGLDEIIVKKKVMISRWLSRRREGKISDQSGWLNDH